MLKEMFIGKQPSHFQINPIVKAFIIAETLLWSGWNFVTPIFAVFASSIAGSNIEIAASAYSAHLLTRVIIELIAGRLLMNSGELRKFVFTIFGMLLMSIAYVGFAFTTSVFALFVHYAVIGVGLGFAAPAKNSLFSSHLDKNKETVEWGILDATVFLGMAMSSVIGGFVAKSYGFQFLFFLSALINFLGIIPYLVYIHKEKNDFFHRFFIKLHISHIKN